MNESIYACKSVQNQKYLQAIESRAIKSYI